MRSVSSVFKISFFITACCSAADGANIMAIYIVPAYSHQMPLLRLSKALAARGHNLTVITANPSKEPITNHTEIDMSFCYEMLRKRQFGFTTRMKMNTDIFKTLLDTAKFQAILGEVQLKSHQIQHFLSWAKDVKFDLVLYEQLWMSSYLAMVHILGSPPVIGISTIESISVLSHMSGSPLNLAYSPVFQPFSDHMNFYERLINVLTYLSFLLIQEWYLIPDQDKLIKEVFGEGIPSLHELEKNKSLIMFSGDGSLGYPHSVTPNIMPRNPSNNPVSP